MRYSCTGLILTIAASFALCTCNMMSPPSSKTTTDLGSGNAAVASAYQNYVRTTQNGGCKATGDGKRAIVTGFNVFQAIPGRATSTKIGFLHYPGRSTRKPQEVFGWAKVIATIIDNSL